MFCVCCESERSRKPTTIYQMASKMFSCFFTDGQTEVSRSVLSTFDIHFKIRLNHRVTHLNVLSTQVFQILEIKLVSIYYGQEVLSLFITSPQRNQVQNSHGAPRRIGIQSAKPLLWLVRRPTIRKRLDPK